MGKLKIKITNAQVYETLAALEEIIKEKSYAGLDFGYSVLKNKKVLKDQEEILKELVTPSEKYKEFENSRIDLLKTSSTDDDGDIHTEDLGNGVVKYQILDEKKDDFVRKFAELKEKYSSEIEEQEKKQAEYDIFLAKEVELDVFKIERRHLPKNLAIAHFEAIMIFMEDEEE